MPFTFDGNTPANIVYNGNDLLKLVYNGDTVWEKVTNSKVTLYASDSYYVQNSNVRNRKSVLYSVSTNGYGCMVFDPNEKFASFEKATLYVYLLSTASFRVSPFIATYEPASYSTGIGNYYSITPKGSGWCEIDITDKVKAILNANPNFPEVGLDLYFRKGGTTISSHTGDYPPYIVLE